MGLLIETPAPDLTKFAPFEEAVAKIADAIANSPAVERATAAAEAEKAQNQSVKTE
jgi:hypothetical protein